MSQTFSFLLNRWYVPLSILLTAIIFSIIQANTQDASGDPYIFWAAGGKFLNGQALYEPIAGAQEFIYPPVAALVFQILAIMPFPWAVGLFTFFNFMAWLALLWLTYKILKTYFPQLDWRAALLVGFVATIRYYWHNIVWANVNELITLLGVGGLYLYIKNKHIVGLGLLILAMWLKVMPVLILGILLIRRPWQTVVSIVGFSALFFIMIAGFRGINQAIQDYFDFWHVAFKPFLLGGRVYTDWIAFGISSTLSKLLLAHPDINGIHYNVVSWPPELVGRISLITRLAILAVTYFYIWRGRQQAQIPLTNIILVYLASLLVSGVSWEGHHVPLLLAIAGLYQLLTMLSMSKLRRWMTIITIIVGLVTPDLVGGHISDHLQAFSLITYNVLFLYAIAIFVSHRLFANINRHQANVVD